MRLKLGDSLVIRMSVTYRPHPVNNEPFPRPTATGRGKIFWTSHEKGSKFVSTFEKKSSLPIYVTVFMILNILHNVSNADILHLYLQNHICN